MGQSLQARNLMSAACWSNQVDAGLWQVSWCLTTDFLGAVRPVFKHDDCQVPEPAAVSLELSNLDIQLKDAATRRAPHVWQRTASLSFPMVWKLTDLAAPAEQGRLAVLDHTQSLQQPACSASVGLCDDAGQTAYMPAYLPSKLSVATLPSNEQETDMGDISDVQSWTLYRLLG